MAEETRVGFHRDLEEIDQKVVQLFALVAEGVAKSTDAFLADDREAAESLVDADAVIDALYCDVEELVTGQLSVPIALEMALVARFYERLGDHAVNIGERIRYIAEGP